MKKNLAAAGWGALNLVALIVVIVAANRLIHGRLSDAAGLGLISALILASYLAGSYWIERRKPVELSAGAGPVEFAQGAGIGFLLFSTLMALLWACGDYHPSAWGSATPLAKGLLIAFSAAVAEEIIFRGFLFRLFAKLVGTWGALVITAALFGALHAFNPGATVGSSVAIALEAGVLLGAAYAATQRLWLPIGLHMAWNFTEGSVFGMDVSGHSAQPSLLIGTLHGSNLMTGGAFGPEASILAVVVCLIAAAYFLRKIVRLHRIEPPMWRPAA
jgi:membrane protease YdiL (CAAX protease family)